MTLIFGWHGSPSLIDNYIRGGDPTDPKRVRELISAHENLPSMHKVFNESLKQFRRNSPSWISYENSQKDIDGVGGFDGLMAFLKSEDLRMQKLGLTQEERKSYLMIMTDPVLAAQYWLRNKEGKTESASPTLYGFDNARTAGQTEAKAESRKIRAAYGAQVAELDDPKYDVPEWFIRDYWSKDITNLLSTRPNQSVTRFRELIGDSRFKQIPETTRNKLLALRDFAASNAPFLQKTIDEESVEFARRDREIAHDIFNTHNGSEGDGLAHVGSAHKAGVLERLRATCMSLSSSAPARPSDAQPRRRTVK